jgi:hypothetical protein
VTYTQGGLIHLDDKDAILLEVDHLVTKSQSKLLALNRLMNVVTRERPPKAGYGASEHALHGLLGDRRSILGLLDGHGSRAGNVADNDGGTHATGAVRLDPGVRSEDVAIKALTEVLDHVVTLRLAVNIDVKAELILDLDSKVDLLLDELVILLLRDLTLGELVPLDTDFAGLREGSDGGSREQRKVKVSLLLSIPDIERRLAVVHLGGNLGLALLDLGVVGAGGFSTRLHGGSVGVELSADSLGVSHGLGEDGNFLDLLAGEGEPLVNIGRKLLLAGQGMRSVKERAGGGDNDAVLTKSLDGGLQQSQRFLEVVLPDVPAVNDTGS